MLSCDPRRLGGACSSPMDTRAGLQKGRGMDEQEQDIGAKGLACEQCTWGVPFVVIGMIGVLPSGKPHTAVCKQPV